MHRHHCHMHTPCFGDLSPSLGIDAVIWRRVSPMSWITLSNIYDVFCCFIRCLTFWYSSAHDCCKLALSPVCVTGHFFCSHLLLDLGHHRSPEISEETVRRCVMQRATVCWLYSFIIQYLRLRGTVEWVVVNSQEILKDPDWMGCTEICPPSPGDLMKCIDMKCKEMQDVAAHWRWVSGRF